MREILVVVRCDRCGNSCDETCAENVEIHKGDGTVFETDICADCWLDWMGNARVRVDPGEFGCGYLDCGKVFKTSRGLSKHQSSAGH